jgi:hypothetical protein
MPIDQLIEKAQKLIKSGRVEFLGGSTYNVVGDHGTYIVVQNYDGTLSCNCLGFLRRGRCSHSTAVLLLKNSPLKRKTTSKKNNI